MNYLQLAQRLREKVGGAGADGTPTTVVGQKGDSLKYVNWIDEAWIEIQSLPDWAWMHKEAIKQLVPGVQAYTATAFGIGDFGSWDLRDIKLYDASIDDEKFLTYMDYDVFRRSFTVGTQTQGRPGNVSVNKSKELVFAHLPDKAYTVTAEYYQSPQHLTANTDIPAMPEQFHMGIVYLAMQYHGSFENAPEVLREGTVKYYQLLNKLMEHQLPEITMGRPLA